MKRLLFVFLLAAAPSCKDSGTTFTFDSGPVADAPKADGGASDGATSDGHTTSDGGDAALPSGGGDASASADAGGAD
jgi:hypothetical protein